VTFHIFVPRAIDEALERLGVVIALRQASEATLPGTRDLHGFPWTTNLLFCRETA
jgi:hypothetical protein